MSLQNGSVTEVCYVTGDMDAAARHWANIAGAGPFYLMPMPEMAFESGGRHFGGRIKAALGFSGTTLVEFIEPLPDTPAIFGEVLERHGEGATHHIMTNIKPISPADFDAICADYEKTGLEKVLAFEVPGQGRNAFFDARREMGVFLEVLECPDTVFGMLDAMYDAHRQGAGDKPLRDVSELFG